MNLIKFLFIFALFWKSPGTIHKQPHPGPQEQSASPVFLPLILAPSEPGTWTRVNSPTLPLDWVRDLVVNPSHPHEILVAFRDKGIYKSSDGGKTWREVYGLSQTSSPSIRQIAVSPSNSKVVYATALNNVLRSSDRGETWTSVWPPAMTGGGWAVAIDPHNPNRVFIGINANAPYHVYETQDGGATWIPRSLNVGDLEGIISLAIDPTDPYLIFAGGNTDEANHPKITRLYKSTDGGIHWSLVDNGFPSSKRVTNISYNYCDPEQIFISRQKHGETDQNLRRSDDRGISWVVLPGIDDDLSISPEPPCPVFTDMQRSLDGGRTWEDITRNFYSLVSDPANVRFTAWAADPWNDTLWVGTREHGIFWLENIVPVE